MMLWTDDLIEFLRQRASEKASASTIVSELGAKGYVVTKNAVIGKCHRKGIALNPKNRAWRAGTSAPRAAAVKAAQRRRRSSPQAVADGLIIARPCKKPPVIRFVEGRSASPVSIHELKTGVCRWPMGGFADRPPYLYCGDPTLEGCSWCSQHLDIATKGFKETTHVTTREEAYPRP